MHDRFRNGIPAGVFLLLCATGLSCNRPGRGTSSAIVLDQVPPPGPGGTGTVDELRGRVKGATSGQKIVVYAQSNNTWWIQPLTVRPLIEIGQDGSWSTITHLGDRYAVLLVNPGFIPPTQLRSLPSTNKQIAAITTALPTGPRLPEKHLHFSNYDWTVRQIGSDRNGSPHLYGAANAFIDDRGLLHLGISRDAAGLRCAEVALPRSLGYGTYAFTVEDTSKLDLAAIFSMFTWDEAGVDQERRELDAVVSHWGSGVLGDNAQFIVQPFFRPANTYRYTVPPGPVIFTFRWEPAKVTFEAQREDRTRSTAMPVAQHTFTSDVPTPATETVHLNLCTFDYGRFTQKEPTQVVIRRFEFKP